MVVGTDSVTGKFVISSDSCASSTIQPGSTCYVYVYFNPTAAGAVTGTLTIADNSPGGPHTVALSGTGVPASQQIVLSQTAVAFGNQPAGSTSSQTAVYISNQGSANVPITNIRLGGANQTDFQLSTGSCSGSFPAFGSCYIYLTFTPASNASGALTASVTLTYTGAGGSPQTITLTGTATAPGPAAALTPSSIAFPKQTVGTTSAAQNFSVTNTGSANLTINLVTSTNSTEFPIASDGCAGSTLTPQQQCVVGVSFSPALGGNRTGSITVSDNATGSPQTLTLTGVGYGTPVASLSTGTLAFGNQNIGTTSGALSVTLSNPGTDLLNISGVTITGANASAFAITTNNCPASLAPNGSCIISATFTPAVAGSLGASIAITDNANNAAGSVQNVALSGTGVAVPQGGASPGSLTFGNEVINTVSAPQNVTLTNAGTGPLSITSIAITGANPSDFAQANGCGSSLPAGTNCTIAVTFNPMATGSLSATLTVTDNANNVSGSTQTVALSGTGLAAPAASLNPGSLSFGNQNLGTTSGALSVTLSNPGGASLNISSVALTGTNASEFAITANNCPASLAPSGSCVISATFTPAATGNQGASISITDNANNVSGSVQNVALTGTGVAVPLGGVSPGSLTFANQVINTASAAQNVTLTNAGTGPLSITSIAVTGTNPTDFAQTNGCGISLPAGTSCMIAVTFKPVATGSLSATLTVTDNANNVSGSTQNVTLSGTGIATPVVTSVSVTPGSGSGATQTFSFLYSDTDGSADLNTVYGMFHTTAAVSHACYVYYVQSSNLIYLENNAGTGAQGSVTPGQSATVANSQCTINGVGSSVTPSGNNLTLAVSITFKSAFTGSKNIYMNATSNEGETSGGLKPKGTWTP